MLASFPPVRGSMVLMPTMTMMNASRVPLVEVTESGLFCPLGGFHVDPWRPVARAVVTHAHADHALAGCGSYLAAREGLGVLRARLGEAAAITGLSYGEVVEVNGVRVSLHPAGHILGSAQVRIEHGGEVWVVSGDYKLESDPTCVAFEPIRCHTFISESTFGLPIYRWQPPHQVFDQISGWWRANQEVGRASVLFAYALGKSQRILGELALRGDLPGPIVTHGAVEVITAAYRAAGIGLPETVYGLGRTSPSSWAGALILAPPSAQGTPWIRRFGSYSSGFASGWMRIRGTRRRRAVDRGFVLSDHADWPGLLAAIQATGAERVWLTHGYSAVVARWLREHGTDADVVATQFRGEGGAVDANLGPEDPGDAPAGLAFDQGPEGKPDQAASQTAKQAAEAQP